MSDFYQYKFDIRHLVETNRLNGDIKQYYIREGIYRNIINPRGGNTKDNAALILVYANKNPKSSVMQFVKDYDNLFIDVFDLVSLGNDAAHAGDKFTDTYFSKTEAERYYAQFENIVRVLYANLVEGER